MKNTKRIIFIVALIIITALMAKNVITSYIVENQILANANKHSNLNSSSEESDEFVFDCFGLNIAKLIRYNGTSNNVVIPETVIDNTGTEWNVMQIASDVFSGNDKIESISIPSQVTSIWNNTFNGCSSLKKVTFMGEKIDYIGNYAFYQCTSLNEIKIPSSVKEIGSMAFQNCTSLTSITIPSSVTKIGSMAFFGCKGLKSVGIQERDSGPEVGGDAFANCHSECKIYVPNETTKNNVNGVDINKLEVDSTAPTIKSIQMKSSNKEYKSGEWTRDSVRIVVNAKDGDSGIDTIQYKIGDSGSWQDFYEVNINGIDDAGNVNATADGTFYANNSYMDKRILIRVIDNVGNEVYQSTEVKIDNVVPQISSIEGNPTEWTNGNVTLKVNVTDEGSGIKEYSFDGGQSWQSSNTSGEYNENQKVTIKVRDEAGNESQEQIINITKIDKTAPKKSTISTNVGEVTNKENIIILFDEIAEEIPGSGILLGEVKDGVTHVKVFKKTPSGKYEELDKKLALWKYYKDESKQEYNYGVKVIFDDFGGEGTYKFKGEIFDKAGNSSETNEIEVTYTAKTIDETKPNGKIDSSISEADPDKEESNQIKHMKT